MPDTKRKTSIKLVADSSLIVKWLNKENEAYLKQADKVLADAQRGTISLFAPELAKYEVGNALLIRKQLTLSQAKTSLATLYALPIQFVSESAELAKETYRLGQISGVTYYDASFGALAKQEKAILITDNPRHQAKFKKIKVVALKNYR